MTVNGIGIENYNAKFWGIQKGRLAITNATEAMDNSRIPVMMRPSIGLREYTVTVHVYGKNRMEQWENAGRITALFAGAVSEVRVPGFPGRKFMLTLTGINESGHGGITNDRWHVLALSCAGYECADGETCIKLDKLRFEEDDADAPELKMAYEASLEELCEASGTEMPTEPEQVNVTIEQKNIVHDAGQMYPGIQGKPGAMDADIRIYGLCKNRDGKDMGPLSIQARSDAHRYKGTGVTGVAINGKSGKVKETVNIYGDYTMQYDMPAPLSWGHAGQGIRIEVTAYNKMAYYPKYEVSFCYTPVYI